MAEEEIDECPVCGAKLDEGAKECPECGEPLIEEEGFECPVCGSELEEEAAECPECGESFIEDEEKKKTIEQLTDIPGLGTERAKKLYEEGFKDPRDVLDEGMEGLAGIDQVGVSTAEKILDGAEELLEERTEEEEDEETEESIVEPIEEPTGGTEELEEPIEATEEEETEEELGVVESITEDFVDISEEGTEEEKEEGKPKRVIIGDDIRENLGDLIPILASFLIPFFLLILAGSELVLSLLDYTSVYPAQPLYYFTPFPYIVPSWIASLIFSFLIVVGLFITTWKGFIFSSLPSLKIDKNMIFLSAIFSAVITLSLGLHIYYQEIYLGILLTIIILALSLFMLVNQLALLIKRNTSFPKIEEKKGCPECGEVMSLDIENCPWCDAKVAVLEAKLSMVDEETWSISFSSVKDRFGGAIKNLREKTIFEEGEKEIVEEGICPTCRSVIPSDSEECPECGEELEQPEKELEKEEFVESELKDLEEELKEEEVEEVSFVCPRCEAEIKEEATECPECGESLTEEDEKDKAIDQLTEISGLGESKATKLYEEGFRDIEDILEGGMEGLASIDQIGVRTAEKILDEAEELIEEKMIEEEPEEGLDEELEDEREENIEESEEEVEGEKAGFTQNFADIADSIRDKLSSSMSLIQKQFSKLPKKIKNLKSSKEEEFEKIEEIEGEEEKETVDEETEEEEKEEEKERVEDEKKSSSFHSYSSRPFKTDEDEIEEETGEESEADSFICPICDADLKEDVDKCPECGTVFVEEGEEEESEEMREEDEEGIVEGVLREDEE